MIFHSKKGYQLLHQCEKCGVEKVNCVASDTEMPDDMDVILRLMKTEGSH